MFKLALWLTTGQCTKEWVAVHRKHHAFTDEEGDPHSPKLEGFWNVQLGNVYYYIREIKKTDVVAALRARHQGRLVGLATSSTTACSASASAPRCCA